MADYIKTIRSLVGNAAIRSVSVGAIIENKEGHILLQKRSDNGLFGLPGGTLELNEKIIDGLKREVHEETGIHLTNPNIFGIYSGESQAFHYPNGDLTYYVALIFYERVDNQALVMNEESMSLAFFPKIEVPTRLNQTDKEPIEKWLKQDYSLEIN
ncbi:MAG: NUDIX domain-containing protein [Acholeplasma sp.]|nr:NUDIX domain-containing protein [Acholeplasma sp.]